MRRIVPSVLIALILFAGCSIKEDRTFCPCYVTLQAKVDTDVEVVDWLLKSKSYSGRGKLSGWGGWSETLAVPRGDLSLLAAAGAGDCLRESGEILIPEGFACPPVYLETQELDTRCDDVVSVIHLHKNYSELSIRGVDGEGLDYELTGDVCGYAQDTRPLEGAFRATAERKDGACVCRVPRQLAPSLSLSVLCSGRLVQTFRLGEYIERSGYDWTMEDLQDLDIFLDLENSSVEISTSEWRRKMTFYIDF